MRKDDIIPLFTYFVWELFGENRMESKKCEMIIRNQLLKSSTLAGITSSLGNVPPLLLLLYLDNFKFQE